MPRLPSVMPSSSALIPMSICKSQCLFSHSFTTYDCDVQIDIGILRADELGKKSRPSGFFSWSHRPGRAYTSVQLNFFFFYRANYSWVTDFDKRDEKWQESCQIIDLSRPVPTCRQFSKPVHKIYTNVLLLVASCYLLLASCQLPVASCYTKLNSTANSKCIVRIFKR
jgi:hypothetical protein